MNVTIKDSRVVDIEIGDWVDVEIGYFDADPLWGYSFQVTGLEEEEDYLWVNMQIPGLPGVYAETALTAALVTDNFRKMPDIV